MHWQSGDKVILSHTGSPGVLQRFTGEGLAMVLLDGDREPIPVPLDALLQPGQWQATPARQAADPTIAEGKTSGSRKGQTLAITLDPDSDLHRSFYLILINDDQETLPFSFHFRLPGRPDQHLEGELRPKSWRQISSGPMDLLNDHPELDIRRWQKAGLRQIALPPFQLRLKARSVVTRQEWREDIPFQAAFFPLPDAENPKAEIPVKTIRPAAGKTDRHTYSTVPDPAAKATFETILDLHIEKLVADPRKLTEAEIYQQQVMVFDQYLARAVRMGIPRVFVIHGLGKGKLRDTILDRCARNDQILRASNAYHPLFGFGATEIILHEET